MRSMSVDEVREEAARRNLRLALIVTALDLELQAVVAHLTPLASVLGRDGAIYECGLFHDVGQDWLVIVAETGAGTHPAQGVVTNAHIHFEPEVQIFVGVGGSRKEDVPIGSVVAADHVYMPYSGKYGDNGFSARPREFPAHPKLLGVARKVRRDKVWIERIRDPADGKLPLPAEYPVAFPPLGHIAPAVSTEAVLASTLGDLADLIANDYGDACIVEMEGYGAIYAASQELKPAIVIRGVSDMTEKKEPGTDKIRQPIAACHAAAFAFELLVQWGHFHPQLSAPGSARHTNEASLQPPSATDAPNGAAPAGPRATYILNLDSEPSSMTPERVASIEAMLREFAGAPGLTIEKVEEGSVRLFVSDPTGAMARVDVPKLRDALENRLELRLLGLAPEHEVQELSEISEELLRASSDLLAWPATLPDGEQIERPELQQLLAITRDEERSATVVIGDPGSGKSALLATLGRRLVEQGYPVLAIKADLLDTEVNNEADLREKLDLSDRPSSLLARLAGFRPTFLLIDQLDALAGYLDLRTGRLSALLNLVRRLGRTANIHVVLSARRFEFDHDVRLRSISAESLHLQLPAWSQVLPVLESKAIAATGWPNDAKEVLRSPQALATYLQLRESARSEPLGSYQAMLDRLWSERILKGPGGVARSQLASSIADTMAEEESLWLARSRFEEADGDIEALIAAGILTSNASGISIGFAHQTVFDYALARAFSQGKGRLSGYVLERQSSLFVRPKVWAALTYLRDADMNSYNEELGTIWSAQGLRRHLRLLLIDFLGQQAAPTNHEALLMEEVLRSPGERAIAFRAMSGSVGWFQHFGRSYFAKAMREGAPAADWVLDPLVAAWSSDGPGVTALIRDHWLPDSANDTRAWLVIQRAPTWTDELLEIATTIQRRTSIAPMYMDHLIAEVGVEQPAIALKLLQASLDQQLNSAKRAAEEIAGRTEPPASSPSEQMIWRMGNSPREPIKRLIETSNEWDMVPALAERAPAEFIAILWPWYIDVLAALRRYSEERDDSLGYVLSYEADFRFEGEHSLGLPEPFLLAAARIAVEKLAIEAPDVLRAWVAESSQIEFAPVQRLIAHSFTANPVEFAGDALAFLSSDHRRLYLGSIESQTGTTARVIESVSDHWTETQVRSFELMVWNFKPPAPQDLTAPSKRAWQNILRRLRLDLLRALPARRASEQTRRRLQEEERALPGGRLGVTFSGVSVIGSTMSVSDISRASDDDVINAFKRLPDSTQWSHPHDWEKGGNIQLAREFANFAKAEPDRALNLIDRFAPDFGQRAAGYALEAMSETANAAKVMKAIVVLADRGFDATEFRGSVAMAVDRLINRKSEIDEAVVGLFKRWLLASPSDVRNVIEEADDAEELEAPGEAEKAGGDDSDARSLLWGQGGISILPHGAYPVLQALIRIYLRRNDIPPIVEVLNQALDNISDRKCWQHLLRSFIYLRPINAGDATGQVTLLQRILDRFPEFVGTAELAYLLGHIHWWAPDLVERELLKWKAARGRAARYGYGELVTLLALLYPERPWPKEALAEIGHSLDHDARAGAAMTAVNLWSGEAYRARATDLLVWLLPDAGASEWSAVFDLFRINDELTPEANTIALLEAIADNMDKAPQLNSAFVVDRLETLLPHEAPLVARIAKGLVRKWRNELGDIRTGTAATAPQFVDLAVTLHRLGPATREDGTHLFEQLLNIDAYMARATLNEIDSRFSQERAYRRPRLPRRSQKQGRRVRAA
jgi:nucleoside phosphorylase/adenylate kinase family enzyme